MPKGTIKRLMSQGYGFIKTDQEEDIFFHSNSLEGVEFDNLSEGQEVEFEKGQGRDGRPAAVNVKLVEAQSETQAETQVDDSGDDKDDDDKDDDDKDDDDKDDDDGG